MTTRILILFIVIIAFSCGNESRIDKNYVETKPSFYSFRHEDLSTLKWVRDNRTLKTFHETFKKIGYDNLIDANLYNSNPFLFMGVYINRPLKNILDSLELTYTADTVKTKYFREFWNRRINEGNDSIVYEIIKEINRSIGAECDQIVDEEFVNDTLYNLLLVEFKSEPLTKAVALDNFNRLKKFGFHQSACNIILSDYKYDDITINRDSLEKTLTPTKEKKKMNDWFLYNQGP